MVDERSHALTRVGPAMPTSIVVDSGQFPALMMCRITGRVLLRGREEGNGGIVSVDVELRDCLGAIPGSSRRGSDCKSGARHQCAS